MAVRVDRPAKKSGRARAEPTSSGAETRARGRPPRLSREAIVAAALAVVREGGLEALTMRLLADKLGATPMALYRHVGDRDALVLLVVEAALAELAFPSDSLDAIAWLRTLAHRLRALGREHTGLMDVLLDEGPAVRSALVVLDRVVRKVHAEGASWKTATTIHNTFLSWLAASVRREERWSARARVAPPLARFLEVAASMPAKEFPGLARAMPHMPGADVDTEFERSLSLVLEGIAVRISAER